MNNDIYMKINNENIIRTILSYCNCKDISQVCQSNKNFNKICNLYFNEIWRERCNDEFCSNYYLNQILCTTKESEQNEKINQFSINNDPNINDEEKSISWKEKMKIGIEIKLGWLNSANLFWTNDDILLKDIQNIHTEIYSNLKEYFALPRLRKENFHVESEINTTLQTYFYDNLSDQQFLYQYYDKYFDNRIYQEIFFIDVKNKELPLTHSLENFDTIFHEIQSEENKNILFKLRWYNFNEVFSSIEINQLLKLSQTASQSRLIFILNCLYLTISHFSQISYHFMMKYIGNDVVFLNEYIKRYKSYTEVAVYLNDYLENLNVLVNYTYDLTFGSLKSDEKLPKFSILRLMLLTWNSQVLNKINFNNNVLYEKIINFYCNYLDKEIINCSFTESRYSICKERERDYSDNMVDLENISFISSSTNYSVKSSNNNSLTNSLINLLNDKSKEVEIDFESMSSYIIEQSFSIMNDFNYNEFSIFGFNHSLLNCSPYVEEFERSILDKIDIFLISKYIEITSNQNNKYYLTYKYLNNIIKNFKNSQLHNNKLNNRLKMKIFNKISKFVSDTCLKTINSIFREEYLVVRKYDCNNLKESKDYSKYFQDLSIDNFLMNFLFEKNQVIDGDNDLLKYNVIQFIKEYSKNSHSLFLVFEEVTQWYEEENEKQSFKNRQVEKEMKRRHLYWNPDTEKLLSYSHKVCLEEIRLIYSDINEATHSDLNLLGVNNLNDELIDLCVRIDL